MIFLFQFRVPDIGFVFSARILFGAPSDVAQVFNLLYRRFPIGRA